MTESCQISAPSSLHKHFCIVNIPRAGGRGVDKHVVVAGEEGGGYFRVGNWLGGEWLARD